MAASTAFSYLESTPPVLLPCAGDGVFPGKFTPLVLAAGKTTFAELCTRPFGPHARLVFILRKDQEEAYEVSARLRHMFPSRVAVCILPGRTSGPLETVQAAVRQLSLTGPFFVCDCDHSIDVTAMQGLLPWSSILVPTWPMHGQRSSAWGKVRVDESGRVREVCEKETMVGDGVLGRIGCFGFPDITVLLKDGVPCAGGFGEALAHFIAHPDTFPSVVTVPIKRADFFGDEMSLKEFQASRSSFLVDIDGTIVEHNTDRLLPGAVEKIREWRSAGHLVILTTARSSVPPWLVEHDAFLTSLGPGPRVLINDAKPQWPGGQMAQAFTVPRNVGLAALELEDHAHLVSLITTGASSASVAIMKMGADNYFVRKHAIGEAASTVLRRQADDLERLAFLCPEIFPVVKKRRQTSIEFWYEMDYFRDYSELWHSPQPVVEAVVLRVLHAMRQHVYAYSAPVDGRAWLDELLREKVLPRLEGSALANSPSVIIDGVEFMGLRKLLDLPPPLSVVPVARCPIHGDLTLENILHNMSTGEIKVIDPAGARTMDVAHLDLGKLFQSLLGDYERTKSFTDIVSFP